MTSRVQTVAFQGIETLAIEVQAQISAGIVAFTLVGLPDKAVAESRERVRAALSSLGLSLPAKRLTINLAPADLLKEGSHFDLPIALAILAALDVVPADALMGQVALGELALDGTLLPVAGVLPAAIEAQSKNHGLICPAGNGGEAAWAGELAIAAAPNLLALINHLKGTHILPHPEKRLAHSNADQRDLADIKGQENAKRALEIAAAGGHNLLLVGPPGSGKSMLASRLGTILPPLTPAQALQVSMIHSVAGLLPDGRLITERPYRDPHHSASTAALVGGGLRAKPGEVSLAHQGVLFLDELPEFARGTLEALRQPIESGKAVVARANMHVTYPSRCMIVAAMNPCRCGYLSEPALGCGRAPKCGQDYQSKISGPLLDRFDLQIEVPAVSAQDLALPPAHERSATIAARVAAARAMAAARYATLAPAQNISTNAEAEGELLEAAAQASSDAINLLRDAADKMQLSARGWHRVLRVARTLADLQQAEHVAKTHVAEALSYRRRGVLA